MLLQEPFVSGSLLLDTLPSNNPSIVSEPLPLLFTVLSVTFVLLSLIFLPRFLGLIPLLYDSLFRARGSVSLENSVRYSSDRRLLASLLLIPVALVTYRYRIYDAAFLRDLPEGWRLLAIMGVFTVFALLRLMMYALLRPRRNVDLYRLSRRMAYTFFIVMVLVGLMTSGLLALFGCAPATIKWALLILFFVFYAIFLVRRTQILALSCNPLRTFLYLCGLEIIPSAALVISAIVL